MKMKLIAGVAASLALLSAVPAQAQQKTVRIGAIYPLSGALASTGAEIKAAVELAVDIVNNPHPELEGIPLAAGSGLPALGGAKIEVVFGDSQGKPEVGLADAQRLIDQEKVVALTGAYQSAVTKTASRIAEQRGIPYVNGESSSPDLTERGYKWFFRTSPNDDTFVENMMQFLDGIKAVPTAKIAVVYENTDFGVNTYKAVEKFAKQYKRELVANIAYSAGSASVTAEVQKLAAARADVAIFASYTSDAMLFVRTMRESKYAPPVLLANDAGFIDSRFVQEVGPQVQGVLTRDVWGNDVAAAKAGLKKINDMYKAKTGKDLNGNNARSMQGVLVLADAINRAGSTDPEAIRKALAATDLGEAQVAMPWAGVQFDAKGQNTKGSGLILELKGSSYQTVWPEKYRTDKTLPTLPFSWK
ncbi:ABC transporter substrate-binding protein [Achromobacter marplatensis]|jgi:branched-chain amino acid transport system substrate-binding protein|uniref:ABC transporter substrate-binding protein n=1 Tax=Achromobacter marplatensis TaxID=470868 RepID=A0AA42W7D5_9BURK|nr:ABC transporter substrate-binding protein [Achromobacter marplatensis]MDH2049979.1 ABC transporter substrate-binding protein [Achromobacter marplatensis]OWT72257.1 ABC transporter substrate-binding protein [Achromobacter marplatensis]RBP24462.1 amino acid/amide ABC transporter substrate-binding protein (HAAT family) [Achromobacter marplatensis]CAB3626566.1 Leu/Ile/Val-binding protein [Achromobacter marplatensis]